MDGYFELPDGTRGFIDGTKPNHECNSDGSVIILANGQYIEDTDENRAKHYDDIRGGSVVCTICGRAAIDRAMWENWDEP